MSCKRSAIFYTNLAFIPHIRQNHSTFPPVATKINLISIKVPGISLSVNVSTAFSTLKMNKINFDAVFLRSFRLP